MRDIRRWITPVAALFSLLLATSAIAQVPPGGTFVDDDGSVFEGSIEAIAAEGITRGCNPPTNDRYCPDDPVTRGQMAAFLVRALNPPSTAQDFFTDDEGNTFEADINRLAAAGITKGCNPPANDRFCPGRSVTRGEMAGFLDRAFIPPATSEDFFTDDEGNTFEEEINRIAADGITKGCNPPANDRYCPTREVTRGEMAAFLTRALGLTPIVPPPRPAITLELVASGLDGPVYVTAPAGDDRIFIVEKEGRIRILEDGVLDPAPFLDISGKVVNNGERGLLSMAFHPDYASNGRFFVYYSTGDRINVVSEFEVSANPDVADPNESVILSVSQQFFNHNGGHILFGPDGYLYVGKGDGGSGNDPDQLARDPDSLLGKLLRIDVDGNDPYESPPDNPYVGEPGRDEIWAIGLRNPWRFWFDGGLLYIGDVGQGSREEVNVVDDGLAGVDYGWSRFEGTVCNPNDDDPSCSTTGLTFPVLEYSHSGSNCSVTGGVVYRGSELPQLSGFYLYGDLCSGWIRGFRYANGTVVEQIDLTDQIGTVPGLWSFGVDAEGEVYVMQGGSGRVYRLSAG